MKHSKDNSNNKNARGYLAGSQVPSPRHAEAHALHERSRDDSGRDDGESPEWACKHLALSRTKIDTVAGLV